MIEGDTTLGKWRTKVRIYHWTDAQIRPVDFCKLCKKKEQEGHVPDAHIPPACLSAEWL